jgi:hypothetical protein
MEWIQHRPGTLINREEYQDAMSASFSNARREGSAIIVPCYSGDKKVSVIFDLEAREVVAQSVRIAMHSITRCDIDYYVIEGDMKESRVFCLIISDGTREVKLSDRVKEYYGISDPDLDRQNDRLVLNIHALPISCGIPFRQTGLSAPPDLEKAFTESTERGQASPPGRYDALIGCGCLLAIAALVMLIILYLIRR